MAEAHFVQKGYVIQVYKIYYNFPLKEQAPEGAFRIYFSLYNSHFKSLSDFFCGRPFPLIFPYICHIFFSRMCCPYTVGYLSIPSVSSFLTLMMNGDFWGSLHYLGQSFINKCNSTRQVSLINAE